MREIQGTLVAAMLMAFGLALGGCDGSQPCEVEHLEEGSKIVCPGLDAPIETDGRVDGDCWKSEGKVECTSGETFDVGPAGAEGDAGVDGADAASDVVVWPDGGADEAGDGQGSLAASGGVYGDYRAPCQRVGTTDVVCADGRTASVEEDVADDATCTSEMIAGVGRRIICGDTQVVPDQPEGADVECTYREHPDGAAVTCSDGTIVAGDQVPSEPCEPTIERRGNDVIEVRCGPMLVERELGPCERDWIIETRGDLEDLQASTCTSVAGDILIRGARCELEELGPCEVVATCGEAEPVTVTCDQVAVAPPVEGPCHVDPEGDVECASGHDAKDAVESRFRGLDIVELEGIDYIGGDLVIEELPFLQAVIVRGLVGVGGSLVIRRNPVLERLASFRELEWLTEDLSISEHPTLTQWTPPLNLQYIDNSFLLSGNAELAFVGLEGNFRMPQKLSLNGAGVVTDNGFDWCVAVNLGRFLGSRAGASQVYIGGEGASRNNTCSFIDWQ